MLSENHAFIDGQNLIYNTKRRLEGAWSVDLSRLLVYLKEKYRVKRAYYFVGIYSNKYEKMYSALVRYGYEVIFREHDGRAKSSKKGNVDTDIVFSAMKEVADREKFGKILLVSNDGDYWRMVNYLIGKNKFEKLLAPSHDAVSYLYRTKISDRNVDYLDKKDIKRKIILRESTKNVGSP